jgi:hypothetical protein
MASYLDNLAARSQITRVTPFTPDWSFLDSAQKTLTQMQSNAFDSFAQQYSTYMKSGLLREDNIEFRDKFLKEADTAIKQVSGVDLTDPRNLKSANSIFTGLVENPYYVNDLVYTKQITSQLGISENLRSASDPAARSRYNPYSEKELTYAIKDFKEADPETAAQMKAPRYVEGVDFRTLSKNVLDTYGINSSVDELSGDLVYTYKNGEIVEPEMRNTLLNELSKDPLVQDYLNTYSNVSYRDMVESYMQSGLDKSQAQAAVSENFMLQYQMTNPVEGAYDIISNYMTAEDIVKRHEQNMESGIYSYSENSPAYKDYQRALKKRDELAIAQKDASEIIDNYTTNKASVEKEQFVKRLMQNSFLDSEIANQARAFSLKDSGVKITVGNSGKAASKKVGSGEYELPTYIEEAPGGDVKESTNFFIKDAQELRKRGGEIQRLRKSALSSAFLIDTPEIKSLFTGVNINNLNSVEAEKLFDKVDNAIKNSTSAKLHPAFDDFQANKDLITKGIGSYYDLQDTKINNNKYILKSLEKDLSPERYTYLGLDLLLKKDGGIATRQEYENAYRNKFKSSPSAVQGVSNIQPTPYFPTVFRNPDDRLVPEEFAQTQVSLYDEALKTFQQKYNSTVRRAVSPISSVFVKSEGFDEGKSLRRVTYAYDQIDPSPKAMNLLNTMYENIGNGPADVGFGDMTKEDFKNNEAARQLLTAIRPRLFSQNDSETANRIQYQIAYQDAAFGELGKAAYVLKFSDPSMVKEFMPSDLSDEEKATWNNLLVGGITVVMDDKNMINKPTSSDRPTLTGLALNANNGILEEEFEGYGTFSAIKGNNGNVFVSIKTLEDTIVQEYPVGSLDDVYLQMRKAYYAFLRQNNK